MKSISSLAFVAAAAVLSNAATEPIPGPAILERQFNALTYKGCYSSSSGLSFKSSFNFNTKGYCQTQCVPNGGTVQATTNKSDCWCGKDMPPSSSKVDDSFCNDPCAGYGTEMCGSSGSKYFSVYLTGLDDTSVGSAASSSSPSSSPSQTTTAKPSVVTVGGQTVVVTASGSADSEDSGSSKGGPSKAGITAGVVVGIVAIAAIAGGAFLFLRNRKRRAIEEEYKRNAAVNNFIGGGKPPTSSGGNSSFTDTRLDPVLAQRRMSDGSIADNQDYSRRILKVTNA